MEDHQDSNELLDEEQDSNDFIKRGRESHNCRQNPEQQKLLIIPAQSAP